MAKYTNFWRFLFDPIRVESMDDLVSTLEQFAAALTTMRLWQVAGIQVDTDQDLQSLDEGYICFFTTDEAVAKEFGFTDEVKEPDAGDEEP